MLNKVKIAKRLSKASSKTFWIILLLVIILIVLVPISMEQSKFAKFMADLFSPTSLRNIAYQGMGVENIGWLSVVAYVLGVILILGIMVPVVTNRIRTIGERYRNGTLEKYHWKQHALFIGYDELMIGTLKKACVDYSLVVVAVPEGVQQIREHISRYLSKDMEKIEVVQCNQNDVIDLEIKACIMSTVRVFIIGQPDNPTHDAQNMRTLAFIAKKWNEQEQIELIKNPNFKSVPHIMVYFRNQSTFSLLQRQGFSAENIWSVLDDSLTTKQEKQDAQTFVNRYCEYFNFYCDKALRMLSTKPEEGGMSLVWHSAEKNIGIGEMAKKQVHLVVLGMTQMGTALVRELLKLAHPSGKETKLLITMVDENAYEEMHFFIGRTKELFKLCHFTYYDYRYLDMDKDVKPQIINAPKDDFLDVEFEFIQCDVANPVLTKKLEDWSADEKQLLTLVICTNDSPKNMAVAMYLAPEMICGENAVPTWIYQEGDDSVQQLFNQQKYPSMHPFSFADHAVASTANSPMYEWDKTVIQYYEKHYKNKKNTVSEEWENKPQDKRWSSLYSIKSMGIKLRAVGVLDVNQHIEESKKKLIDYYEHNRWVVERLTMGSRPTDKDQHAIVDRELKGLLIKYEYSEWGKGKYSQDEIEQFRHDIDEGRVKFKALKDGITIKGIKIHDDIRSFNDLDDFTKDKDRKILDDYIEAIRNNPRVTP